MPAPRLQLRGTGQITLADIATIFLGTPIANNTGLSKFYRTPNGVYPNAINNPWNGGIPMSGTISIGDFYGATNYWGYMVISSTPETFAGPYAIPQVNGTITVTVYGPKPSYSMVIAGQSFTGTTARRTGLPTATHSINVVDDAGAHVVGINLGGGGTFYFNPAGGILG